MPVSPSRPHAPIPARFPRADELLDVAPHEVPWVAPPVGTDHAAELLHQALVADAQRAALDTARGIRGLGELTVASARLAVLTAQRAGRRKPPWLR